MMRALFAVAIGLATRLASAETVALSAEQTTLLDGHLAVRLPEGMIITGEHGELAWGLTRFSIEARELPMLPSDDPRDRIAKAIGALVCARVERLSVRKPWVVYALVPRLPPRVRDRELVALVYAATSVSTVELVAFYVDEPGFDDAPAWAALARHVGSTMVPVQITTRPMRPLEAPPRFATRAGWKRIGDDTRFELVSARAGRARCKVRDSEIDARAVIDPARTQLVPARIGGRDVDWTVWNDGRRSRAELMTGTRRWGTLHVTCEAESGPALDQARDEVAAYFAEMPE
ncbi:MAG: hypothetical protein JWO36_1606 [Myxococcales bacterium]|nr:hypothetical protein [Myxococcales bacterium]